MKLMLEVVVVVDCVMVVIDYIFVDYWMIK